MKKLLIVLILLIKISVSNAQEKLDDFGRIILNSYLPKTMEIPDEAKALLNTKLNQITSANGMGGSIINPQFIITSNLNVESKDIIAGPPMMVALSIDISFFVGDAINNVIFSTTNLHLKGVGGNENKALIDAIRKINPQNKEIKFFLEEGKSKIISYYNTRCDFNLKNAQTLTKQNKFDEAIFQLSLIPEICQDCYFKSLDTLTKIHQSKINMEGLAKLKTAKSIWSVSQTKEAAEKAGLILNQIDPLASCQLEIDALFKTIEDKLKADEKAEFEFILKQYEDQLAIKKEEIKIAADKAKRDDSFRDKQSSRNFELDKIRILTFRKIAVKHLNNQPKLVSYSNINWK
jgi:hypothetical protein